MFNQIRVGLVCLAIATVGIPQIVGNPFQDKKDSPAFENEYVRVQVIPPLTRTPSVLGTCNAPGATVLVYVPTHEKSSIASAPQSAGRGKVTARYIGPGQMFTCPMGWGGGIEAFIDVKAVTPASVFSDDAVKLDAEHNETIFENDQVRVVRIHFQPGEAGPIVDKRARVIIARTDSHATVTFPDGHSETREVKAGTVSFGNAGRQGTKNTGTTPIENIVVELKSK